MSRESSEVTQLLSSWSKGDSGALEKLMPLVFDDLLQLARKQFEHEAPGHTLQPTALVNEVYLKLVDQKNLQLESRAQFFAFAATLIRRILVDHARKRNTAKRGSGGHKFSLDESIVVPVERASELVALDDALTGLEQFAPRQSHIIVLRTFTGLSLEEIGEVLGISLSTVKREQNAARAWLRRALERWPQRYEVARVSATAGAGMSGKLLARLQATESGEEREWLVLENSLSHLSKPLQKAVWAAAIPHWFDTSFLAALLDASADRVEGKILPRLSALSFVELFPGRGYNVHERSRTLLLKRLWRQDRELYRELSRRSADFCSKQDAAQISWRIELLYHAVVADSTAGLGVLKEAIREWQADPKLAVDQVEAMIQLLQEHKKHGRLGSRVLEWMFYLEAFFDHTYLQKHKAAKSKLEFFEAQIERAPELFLQKSILLGMIAFALEDHLQAKEQFEQAIPAAQQLGDRLNEAHCLYNLGLLYFGVNELEQSAERLEQALLIKRQLGIQYREARCLQALGDVHFELRERQQALTCYEQAASISRKLGSFGIEEIQKKISKCIVRQPVSRAANHEDAKSDSTHFFTEYSGLLQPGSAIDAHMYVRARTALRITLSNELKIRGLWATQPQFLGIYGYSSWSAEGALEELVSGCYLFTFAKRQALQAQLKVKPSIEGLVIRNVRNFLSRREELYDPIGRRVYSVLGDAVGRLIEAGELHVLGEDPGAVTEVPKITNETILGFAPSPDPRPAWTDDFGANVRSWNEDLLPDLITAMGLGASKVIQRLMAHLRGLRDAGCEAFRFKDLLDALKSDVRARWKVLQEFQLLQLPGKDFEQRERFETLVVCVEDCLDAQRGSERRKENLWKLWRLIRAVTADSWAGEVAEPPARDFADELPSKREMARILGIPKGTLSDLYNTIQRCVEECLETLYRGEGGC